MFFSELKYTYVEAEPAYTLLALTCDIGGALGLIVGSAMPGSDSGQIVHTRYLRSA